MDETTLMTLTHVVFPGGGSSERGNCSMAVLSAAQLSSSKCLIRTEKVASHLHLSSDYFLKKVTLLHYSTGGKVSSLKISRRCCVIVGWVHK